MKLAPVWKVLRNDPDFQPIVVHTGLQYDDRMSGQFFRDLGLPPAENPLGVVVLGNVNSTVACALVAAKMVERLETPLHSSP